MGILNYTTTVVFTNNVKLDFVERSMHLYVGKNFVRLH